MNPLIQKLEAAALRRNPGLAQILQPGLAAAQIQKQLKRGGIEGAVDRIIELYSWRNGTQLHGHGAAFEAAYKGGLVPPRTIPMTESEKEFMRAIGVKRDTHPEHYHLMDLKSAVSVARGGVMEGYFPFLWETGRGSAYIALSLKSDGDVKVVKVETLESRDKCPVREAYNSFQDFLTDAIRCNEENKPLTCLGVETRPITLPSATASAPGAAASSGTIPVGENTLAVRTDFSDEAAWKSLCASIQEPVGEFRAYVDFVSDPAFDGLTAEELPSALSQDSRCSFVFIIDSIAISRPDHPILVVDLFNEPGRTFRVIPSAMWSVENNLSIANMGFEEFSDAVDQDGVFRGFPET